MRSEFHFLLQTKDFYAQGNEKERVFHFNKSLFQIIIFFFFHNK